MKVPQTWTRSQKGKDVLLKALQVLAMAWWCVGMRVHAVDSLGRWEAGQVVKVGEDQGPGGHVDLEVRYQGWPANYNDIFASSSEKIRPAFLPEKKAPEQDKRQREKLNAHQERVLRTGVVGNVIKVGQEKVSIVEVDRFNRTLIVNNPSLNMPANTIRATDISSEEVPGTRRKTARVISRKSDSMNSSSVSVAVQTGPSIESKQSISDSCFKMQDLESGQTYQVSNANLIVGVKDLHLETKRADCWLLENNKVQTDIMISVPIGRLNQTAENLSEKRDRDLMEKTRKKSYAQTVENLKCEMYRKLHRKYQLQDILQKEIKCALNSSTYKRMVSLGPINHEHDAELLGINMPLEKSKAYDMKHDNLCQLDNLLGSYWDVQVEDTRVKFVTSIRFRVNKNFILHVHMKTGSAMLSVQMENYRKEIKEYLVRNNN